MVGAALRAIPPPRRPPLRLLWFNTKSTMTTRRNFLSLGAMSAAALGLTSRDAHADTAEQVKQMKPPAKPVIVTRVTGDQSIQQAYQMLLDGTDTLEAAHHICIGRENDPSDHSVGLGGLPNEEGVVELDSCCMHGPTRRAGSVGGVRNIKNVCPGRSQGL